MNVEIRAPEAEEFGILRDIERAAGALFAEVGMPDIAAHEPSTVEELTAYRDDGRIWVVVADGVPVGFALVDIVDGNAHLENLSVDPRHGRRGRGAALLQHVCAWAHANGHDAVTLTTFEHVEWNAPYYARHGFRVMADDELGPELRDVRDRDAHYGLDPALRVVMRKDVAGGQNGP